MVVAIAPASFISSNLCHKAYNYICAHDCVWWFDPIGLIFCWKDIFFVFHDPSEPFVDHSFGSKTYRGVIKKELKTILIVHRKLMRYLFLFLFAYLTSCLSTLDIPSGYERIAYQASRRAAKTLSKRHQMKQMGLGGGMMDQVNMMYIAFHINRFLTIKEAREILIDCVQEYLATINADEKLRPFLVTYPFGIKNVEVDIFASNPEGYNVVYPYVSAMGLYEGKISYYKDDPNDEYKYKSKIRETYQEALDIINSQYAHGKEDKDLDDWHMERRITR